MANMINSKAPLSGLAKLMAMKGRDGDTMLAHINPMESKMLSAMGGRGSINPATGLQEFAGGLTSMLPESIQGKLDSDMKKINSDVDFEAVSSEHGINNFTEGKELLDGIPREWQSAPNQPKTKLAYVTDAELDSLRALNPYGKPNPEDIGARKTDVTGFGPADIPSMDSGGSGDGSGSDGGGSDGGGSDGGGSSGYDEGGYGDLGSGYDTPAGVNEGNFGGGNTEVNDYLSTGRPMGSSKDGGRTTAQIVFDDNYNKMGSFGNLHHELNPQGTEGPGSLGYSGGFDMGGLGSLAKFALGFTPLAPAVAAYSMGTGLYDALSPKDNKDTKGVDESKGAKSISNIPGNLIDNATDKFNSTVDTISGLGSTLSKTSGDLWGSLVDVVAGDYIGTSGAAGINNGKDMYAGASMLPDDVADARAIGDGSALFGGTAFTPEQNESAFGDSGGSTEPKRQMRYIQQRAQAPDATPEEVLRWKQVSNPDYIYTPEAMRTYAERGGPSHFKMVQANTGGGLSDLYNMNEGGTFSGMVKGPDGGDGMSDDVAFDIKDDGQGGPDKALLSKDEYVIDAHSMSLLGNGSSDAGADQMDKFIKDLRKSGFGTTKQPKQLDGAEELSKLL